MPYSRRVGKASSTAAMVPTTPPASSASHGDTELCSMMMPAP